MRYYRLFFMAVLLTLVGRMYADTMTVVDVNLKPGESKTASINLENPTKKYTAFQFDLVLPEGVTVELKNNGKPKISLNEDRIDDHTLTVQDLGSGSYRLLCFSMSNTELYGTSGALITMTLHAAENASSGAKAGSIKSQVFTEASGNQVKWNDFSFTVTIAAAVVPEITADNKSREYGEENPAFTYTTSASLTGEPSLTTTATKTSPVGEYDIVVERGTVTGDYTTKDGKLTITKAPLTVTAKSYTIKQGDALPTFEAEYSGFKNNETASVLSTQPTVGTTATSASEPGIYDIIVSGASATNYDITYVKGTLTVGSTQYDEGYSVSILPFLVTEDAEGTFLVTNATALTNVEFDVELPSEFITNELYGIDRVLSSVKFSTSDELNGNIIHVSVARKSSNKIAAGEDTELAALAIAYNNTLIASGAHSITIKNIVLTDVDGNEYHAAPFTTYLIQDAYSRPMYSQWGTICLPYATQTTDDVQLYELSNVDFSAGSMTFSPVNALSANTPAIFKTTSETATFPVAEADVATGLVVSAPAKANGWTTKGAYYDQELDPAASTSDIYYISGDKFYYANQTFAVGAFRAWFETAKSVGGKAQSLSIIFEEQATTALQSISETDGMTGVIYDLNGRILQQKEKGINIINGKKVMTK